jgi:hypothetical protein
MHNHGGRWALVGTVTGDDRKELSHGEIEEDVRRPRGFLGAQPLVPAARWPSNLGGRCADPGGSGASPLPGLSPEMALETSRRHLAPTSTPPICRAPTSWLTSSVAQFRLHLPNPKSSRGLQESFINYGKNAQPEWITCCHEESSIAMAHGYFKIEGKPILCMAHGTVGLQHASMALYNAYADRVPVYLILGNEQEIAFRRSDVEWTHSVQDAAAMGRD